MIEVSFLYPEPVVGIDFVELDAAGFVGVVDAAGLDVGADAAGLTVGVGAGFAAGVGVGFAAGVEVVEVPLTPAAAPLLVPPDL